MTEAKPKHRTHPVTALIGGLIIGLLIGAFGMYRWHRDEERQAYEEVKPVMDKSLEAAEELRDKYLEASRVRTEAEFDRDFLEKKLLTVLDWLEKQDQDACRSNAAMWRESVSRRSCANIEERESGATVVKVYPGTIAARVGLKANSIIMRYGQRSILSADALKIALQDNNAERVALVWQDNATMQAAMVPPGKLGIDIK